MPDILFHEVIGYKYAKGHKEYDTPSFFLGVMVPDAVNAYGFASKEQRWKAHFRDSSLEKWKENTINFYKQNKGKYEENYLVGYVIHILTDILCDEIYQEKIYPDLLKKGYDYNTAYNFYRDELYKLESNDMCKNCWLYAKNNFQKAPKVPINNIDGEMIQDWENYCLNQYKNINSEKEEYLTEWFINEVLDRLEKALNGNICYAKG